jgi:hypothetical protein
VKEMWNRLDCLPTFEFCSHRENDVFSQKSWM